MKRIIKTTVPLFLLLCTTLSLTAQDWLWATHAGSALFKDYGEKVIDVEVDSMGNTYNLVEFHGYVDAVICGVPIENISSNYGIKVFTLISLSPEGELRWYKTMSGAEIYLNSIGEEKEKPISMLSARLGFDGTHLIRAASSRSGIRLRDGEGGDTLFPQLPIDGNNHQSGDLILKIDLNGEILWKNSINEIFPVPDTDYYNGDIYVAGVLFDQENNIYIRSRITDSPYSVTTFPTTNNYSENYMIKLTSEGEYIETIPVRDMINFGQVFVHDGKYHTFWGHNQRFRNEGVTIDTITPSVYFDRIVCYWARYSESFELEDWKVLHLGYGYTYCIEQKEGDFYIGVENGVMKMDREGVICYKDTFHIRQHSGYIRSIASLDEENIVLLAGYDATDSITVFSQQLEGGNHIIIYHQPSQSCSYISKKIKIYPHNNYVGLGNGGETRVLPNGNIYIARTFTGRTLAIGDTILLENVRPISTSEQDLFFASLGWPAGETGTWPDPPSNITESMLDIEILLYPNPATSQVMVKTENELMQRIELYNLAGQRVMELPTFASHTTVLNISHLPTGLYVVKIYTQKGIVEKKLVVE